MSIEALNWALTAAPIPTDRKDASTLAFVLVALANHADPDGGEAFPSVERMTGLHAAVAAFGAARPAIAGRAGP
ncbi:MAG: hypothetical protein M3443_04160 [Actinomycetota bacterium]|nr:hypothetical protein [Actinomycetota bacterium]